MVQKIVGTSIGPKVRVCMSPALIGNYDLSDQYVVIIDILRATTSICVALDYGITHIVPVSSVPACASYGTQGYLCAAERDGLVIPGFHFGNSPFSFMNHSLAGSRLALTTTNGTQAIEAAQKARCVTIGAFSNITLLCHWLEQQAQPVLLVCAGWKNNINLEDTIFAGAVIDRIYHRIAIGDDAAVMAHALYLKANANKRKYLQSSSHYQRLLELNLQRDVKYCLRKDTHNVLPVLHEGVLIDAVRHRLYGAPELVPVYPQQQTGHSR
jgi:2-phosphosulfolactate phosphatase